MIGALGILFVLAAEQPALAVEFAAPEAVVVGDSIRLEFSLVNESPARVEVRQAVVDDRAFTFDVRFDDGLTGCFTQHADLPPPVCALEPTGALRGSLELPALAAGTLSVRAIYRGANEPVASPERRIAIAAKGEVKELGLTIATNEGVFRAQWLRHEAPAACLHVARLAGLGRYDAQPIDRVLQRYAIAIGATRLVEPEADASSGESTTVARAPLPERATLALDPSPVKHQRGVLTLWRAGRAGEDLTKPSREGAGNGAFFALLADDPFLDGRYAGFARVVEGLGVLDRLGAHAPKAARSGERSRPQEPLRIETVRLSPLETR